jgi:hypothetical protein
MRWPVAALMVVCAGCNSRAPARHDAGLDPAVDAMPDAAVDAMPDAAVDAMPDAMPDAADPTVRVRVPTDFVSEVAFYSPSNELIALVIADADGLASAAMPAGGTVIVIPDPVTRDLDGLRALFGVKPGDDIKLAAENIPFFSDAMTITVPPKDGAAVYRAGTRCGGGGGGSAATITAFLVHECQPPLSIVLHAEDADGTVIGALRGTSSSTTSAILMGPYLAPDVVSLQFTNGDREALLQAILYPVVDNQPLNELNKEQHRPLEVEQAATFSFATAPTDTVDARMLQFGLSTPDGKGQRYQRVQAANDPTFTFDDRVEGLPWSGNRQYDRMQRKLTLGPLAVTGIDGKIAELRLSGDPFRDVHWTLVIPPDATEIVMPTITNPNLDPTSRPSTQIVISAFAIRASSYDGYDDLRRGVPVTAGVGSYYDVTF